MASNTAGKNGKGRVVTSAPNRAKGKSTTSKSVGVTPRERKGAIVKALGRASVKGAKAFYTDKGAEVLADAIAKAEKLPTLGKAGIGTENSKSEALRRREYCQRIGAPMLSAADILHPNKNGEVTHARPENTVRARVRSVMKALGKNADTIVVVRADKYDGTAEVEVYLVRK